MQKNNFWRSDMLKAKEIDKLCKLLFEEKAYLYDLQEDIKYGTASASTYQKIQEIKQSINLIENTLEQNKNNFLNRLLNE